MWKRIPGGKQCPIIVRIDKYNTKDQKTLYVRTVPSLGEDFLLLVREKIERGGSYQFSRSHTG